MEIKIDRKLILLQFAGIVIWLIIIYSNILLVMRGKLISILFIILGIAFILFHMGVIRDYYKKDENENIKEGDYKGW